jgi:hypothetical protein
MMETPNYYWSAYLKKKQEVGVLALKHNVYVTTKHNYGSAVRIRPDLVLTSVHVYEVDSWVKADGEEAQILTRDADLDLMLLQTEPVYLPPLEIETRIEVLSPMMVAGNIPIKHGLLSSVEVMGITEKRVYVNIIMIDGYSGGGAYTFEGKLGALLLEVTGTIETGHVAFGVSGKVIKKFLASKQIVLEQQQLGLSFQTG